MDAVRGPASPGSDERGADRDEGVLGKLPRSRPGQRSDKRGGRSGAAPAGSASGALARGARAGAAARPRGAPVSGSGPAPASPTARATDRPSGAPPKEGGSLGPIGGAANLAGRAARLGLDVAGDVLKRLPRP